MRVQTGGLCADLIFKVMIRVFYNAEFRLHAENAILLWCAARFLSVALSRFHSFSPRLAGIDSRNPSSFHGTTLHVSTHSQTLSVEWDISKFLISKI